MKRLAPVILLALCAGCATGKPPAPAAPGAKAPAAAPRAPRLSQAEQLAQAVKSLGKGESSAARKLLVAVCDSPPVAGVTDEALFRLALLSVRPAGENAQTHQLLRRLKREYPASPWTTQAQPLAEQLAATDELRRQNRNYRAQKDALTRENLELRETNDQLNKNIEELKHLDLELEKKSR